MILGRFSVYRFIDPLAHVVTFGFWGAVVAVGGALLDRKKRKAEQAAQAKAESDARRAERKAADKAKKAREKAAAAAKKAAAEEAAAATAMQKVKAPAAPGVLAAGVSPELAVAGVAILALVLVMTKR